MKRRFAIIVVTIYLSILIPTAHADVLQTVGDGLKKAGSVAVDLFKKGKDKVMSLFNSADPEKIPYLIILGEKEVSSNTISVRKHKEGDKGTFTVEEFTKMINDEIDQILSPVNEKQILIK